MAKYIYKKHETIVEENKRLIVLSTSDYAYSWQNGFSDYSITEVSGNTNVNVAGSEVTVSAWGGSVKEVYKKESSQSDRITRYVAVNSMLQIELCKAQIDRTYFIGKYIVEVTAEEGSLPDNARHSDGYWYVKTKKAISSQIKIDGVVKDIVSYELKGYGNVSLQYKDENGILHDI